MVKTRANGKITELLPTPDLGAMNAVFESMSETFTGQQHTAMHAAEKMAEETFRFWSRRMQAYAEHLRDLQSCSGPSDYLDLSAKFMNKTVVDYGDETGQIMKMGQDAVSEGTDTLNKTA